MMKELTSFSVIIAHSASPHELLTRATGLIVSFFYHNSVRGQDKTNPSCALHTIDSRRSEDSNSKS